jgi:hypothetical protein
MLNKDKWETIINLSALGRWNFFLFQWFWVRRTRCIDLETNEISYKWLKAYPLSGWWDDFRYW